MCTRRAEIFVANVSFAFEPLLSLLLLLERDLQYCFEVLTTIAADFSAAVLAAEKSDWKGSSVE